jgi:DNA primase
VQAHRSKPRFLLPDAELQTDFILRYDEELSVKDSPLAIEWAKKRGFDLKFCDDMGFRFYNHFETLRRSDPSERPHSYYNCVVIPIYEKGSLVSFEARDVLGKERWAQKKHADGVEYKKVMYPLYSSVNTLYEWEKLKKEEPLYIVEGLMDMFSLRTSPYFKNSSCLFHCIPTERQLGILERFSSITYIIDNDKPGMKGCLKLMEQLPRGKVAFLRVPDRGGKVKDVNDVLQGKDPYIKSVDDLIKMGWMKKISDDKNVLNLLIEEKTKDLK